MRRIHRYAILLVAVGIALFLFGAPLLRAYEALLLVGEFGGHTPSPLLPIRSGVTVRPLRIVRESRRYRADLYLPGVPPAAGIVLLHGAAQTGKDDERLVDFARLLAGSRFAVLVPELSGPKRLRIRAQDAQAAVDAFHFLNRYPGLEKRVGFGGISVSAGLAFLASLQAEIRDEVAFILSVGGYHSLPRTLGYAITGQFVVDGKRQHQPPNSYGKWLFVLSNLEVLEGPADAQALRRIAFRRMAVPGADISDMSGMLSAQGRAVLDYVTEKDPSRIDERFAALPAMMRQHIEALDLANKDLHCLTGRLLLVHGYEDNIIPYAESVSLARALPPGQAELYLVHGLGHVDSNRQWLETAWQFWQVSYALLRERDRKAD